MIQFTTEGTSRTLMTFVLALACSFATLSGTIAIITLHSPFA